jgi:hypothetical protein
MEFWTTSDAERDLITAFDRYRAMGSDLGFDFIRCIDATMALVRHSPQLFRKRYGEVRMAMAPRFPYAIYFMWDEKAGVTSVLRILHFSQNAPTSLRE